MVLAGNLYRSKIPNAHGPGVHSIESSRKLEDIEFHALCGAVSFEKEENLRSLAEGSAQKPRRKHYKSSSRAVWRITVW